MELLNKCARVRQSCSRVVQKARNVKVDRDGAAKFALKIKKSIDSGEFKILTYQEFDCHLSESKEIEELINYTFVLDSLNFCFWPSGQTFEYDNLAGNLKKMSQEHPEWFKPSYLATAGIDFVTQVFGPDFCLLEERKRIINEVGQVTCEYFEGSFVKLVEKSEQSAVKDVAIYEGEQIQLYKRPQILVGDLFSNVGNLTKIAQFYDMDELTMFPDYRVPQILVHEGVMLYSEELKQKIISKVELPAASSDEVEIRAATVIAVEVLKEELEKLGHKFSSYRIDHFLWHQGEMTKDEIFPHHRTISIYY